MQSNHFDPDKTYNDGVTVVVTHKELRATFIKAIVHLSDSQLNKLGDGLHETEDGYLYRIDKNAKTIP